MTRKNSIISLLIYVAFNFLLQISIEFMNISQDKEILFTLLFNCFLILVLVALNYGYLKKSEKEFKTIYIAYVIFAFLFYIIVLNLSVAFFDKLNIMPSISSNQNAINLLFKVSPLPMSILVFFQAPIIEEIVFRSAIIFLVAGKQMSKKKLTIIGCVISVIVFAGLHLLGDIGNSYTILEFISIMFPYFLLSGIIVFLFYKSKFNIFVPLLFHMVNNAICLLLMYF